MSYPFTEMLNASKSPRWKSIYWPHIEAYFGLPARTGVRIASSEEDKAGADIVLELRHGTFLIDLKTRTLGCSKYWQGVPLIALETWSCMPGSNPDDPQGNVGWTLDARKITTHTLHVFEPMDCRDSFLFPFHELRRVFALYRIDWMRQYRVSRQRSRNHTSECISIPANLLMELVPGAQSRTV